MRNDNNDEGAKVVITFLGILIGLVFGVGSCIHETNELKEYGEEAYEYEIIEKYETIGSSWHLIGGRASETEFHVVYKVRCTNRPNNVHESSWMMHDEDVNYMTYRYYKEGHTYKGDRGWLPVIFR